MSVNKAIVLGNVCADPRVTDFADGGRVVQFSVATNKRGYTTKDGREVKEQTEFHNVVINRKGLADVAAQFVKKGIKVYIEGEMRTRQYQNANGMTQRVMEIYVTEMELCTPKPQGAPAPSPSQNDDPFAYDPNPVY